MSANGTSRASTIHLTFDDGPHSVHTRDVLDLLESFGILATFFVIGQRVKENPDLAREIVARGHAIGNHTMSHSIDATDDRNAERYLHEVSAASEVIESIGVRPTTFRPPGGREWGPRTRRRPMAEDVADLGLALWQWDIDAKDWREPSPYVIAERLLHGVEAGAAERTIRAT